MNFPYYCYSIYLIIILGPKLTMEQFLSRLPQNVVKDSKIIDVRGDVGSQLQVII